MRFSQAKRKEDLQKHPFQSSRISANQAGLYHQNLSDEKYNKTQTHDTKSFSAHTEQ